MEEKQSPLEPVVEQSWFDRLRRRRVLRYPDGQVTLEGFSARATLLWYVKQNWRQHA